MPVTWGSAYYHACNSKLLLHENASIGTTHKLTRAWILALFLHSGCITQSTIPWSTMLKTYAINHSIKHRCRHLRIHSSYREGWDSSVVRAGSPPCSAIYRLQRFLQCLITRTILENICVHLAQVLEKMHHSLLELKMRSNPARASGSSGDVLSLLAS
jgi:hypothetical protein